MALWLCMAVSMPAQTYWRNLRVNKMPVVRMLNGQSVNKQIYLLSIDERLMGSEELSLTVAHADTLAVSIDGVAETDGVIRVSHTLPSQAHTLRIENTRAGTAWQTSELYFTFLPILDIHPSNGCNNVTFIRGTIALYAPQYPEQLDTLNAKFRYRGATSGSYEKKNYAVKIIDGQGSSMDYSFLDLYDDNDYILDAMAIDRACLRNRVCTDLWNDIARAPYFATKEPKARVGTNGHFVEVVQNGKYQGLYCLTEKIQRKLLKIKKAKEETGTVRGVLYKSVLWGDETAMRAWTNGEPAAYDNLSETWCGYEMKYPEVDEMAGDWQPLVDNITWAIDPEPTTGEDLEAHIDVPLLIDYYLLTEAVNLGDTYGKNTFVYFYDITHSDWRRKMCIIPWDMDASWGRSWNGSKEYVENPEQILLGSFEGCGYGYFRKFAEGCSDWKAQIDARYNELRSNVLSTEQVLGRFERYRRMFSQSGAAGREEARWPSFHYDITVDIDYITDWARRHLDYLDTLHPVPEGIGSLTAQSLVSVTAGRGTLTIKGITNAPVSIATLQGTVVAVVSPAEVKQGRTLSSLPAGVYVCGGRKVVVR